MITVKGLQKKYGEKVALQLEVLEINAGEHVGVVGNNGAGKTTLFSLILDLIRATTGEVHSKGISVAGSDHWKTYTGSFLDESFLIDYLSPEEYFEFVAKLYQWDKDRLYTFLDSFKAFFNEEILGRKTFIRNLSKGNQKKVGLVAALIGDPEFLLLDEPFANLDPTSQFRLKQLLSEIRQDKTVLISSHDLNHVTDVCERIILLEGGLLVKDIETNEATLKELESYFAV